MKSLVVIIIVLVAAAALTPPLFYPNANAQEDSFTFAAGGDLGHNRGLIQKHYKGSSYTTAHTHSTATTKSLELVAQSGASFFLALGDFSYNGTDKTSSRDETDWCGYVKSIVGPTFPFELVSGNHEENSQVDGYIGNFVNCLPDRLGVTPGGGLGYGQEYYFDYPATNPYARFIMIAASTPITPDSTAKCSSSPQFCFTYSVGDGHYEWLSARIDEARNAGIPWVMVGMHKVCISTGQQDCEITHDLMNLLLSKKVDLILQAHDHVYERSKQLACATEDVYNPSCVVDDGSDGHYLKGSGSVIVVQGVTGGAALHPINTLDSEYSYFASWMGSNSPNPFCSCTPGRGFMKYTVTRTQLTAQFVGSTTKFADSFTIGPPPTLTASFSYTPPAPTTSTTVSFTASASGGIPPYSFTWDFGDASNATGNTASHLYSAAGTYVAVLTATDTINEQTTTSQIVTVLQSGTRGSFVVRPIGPGSEPTHWSKASNQTSIGLPNPCSDGNWHCVNHTDPGYTEPDNDYTYVRYSSTNTGLTDLYDLPTVSTLIPSGSVIESVTVSLVAWKSGSSDTKIQVYIKSGSSNATGDPLLITNILPTMKTYNQTWTISPFTNSAWTVSELDQLQAGQKWITGAARVTTLLVEIQYVIP